MATTLNDSGEIPADPPPPAGQAAVAASPAVAFQPDGSLLQAVLEGVQDGIYLKDRQGRYLLANLAGASFAGVSPADMIGKTDAELLPADIAAHIIAHDQLVMAEGQARTFENTFLRAGQQRTYHTFKAPYRDAGGQVIGLIGVSRDITRPKQAEAERERLYQAEQAARRQAEARADHLARLQALTVALSETLTPAQVAGVIVQQGLTALDAAAGLVMFLGDDGSALQVMASAGYSAPELEPGASLSGDLAAAVPETIELAQPLWFTSLAGLSRRYPDLAAEMAALPPGRAAILPLVGEGRVLGGVLFNFVQAGEFSAEEQAFLLTLAGYCAQASHRAHLYAAEQEAREHLQQSLREKELLLHEVNHRIKNNLQAIVNLLYLQAQYIQDPATRQKFEETQNRVKSIALIHEKMYRTGNFDQVDFADYTRDLAAHLVRAYRIEPDSIRVKVESDHIVLGQDSVVSLGIIVNELVSNALKHAFPDNRGGEIEISLKAGGEGGLTLTVRDNGVGFPVGQDLAAFTGSLGLQLVQMLTGHMRGTVELAREGGTRFTLIFPPPRAAP